MKYKIKYKANDSTDDLKVKVGLFYKEHPAYKLLRVVKIHDDHLKSIYEYEYKDKEANEFEVGVDYKSMEIFKYGALDFSEFSKDELQFFDNLGFEVDEDFKEETNQEITDWF